MKPATLNDIYAMIKKEQQITRGLLRSKIVDCDIGEA
jgi:hypothetical protein